MLKGQPSGVNYVPKQLLNCAARQRWPVNTSRLIVHRRARANSALRRQLCR